MATKKRTYPDAVVRRMVINPYVDGNIMDAYPILAGLVPPDTFGISIDRLFRWLSFVYDHNSPMAETSNISMRKQMAAEEVGLTVEFTNDYRHIIIPFIKQVCSSMLWAEICVNDNLFWSYCDRLSQEIIGANEEEILKAVERQGKMADSVGKFRERSESLRKLMFANDTKLEQYDEDMSAEGNARAMRPATAG